MTTKREKRDWRKRLTNLPDKLEKYGKPEDEASQEERPMMIGAPIVESLKCLKSAGTCQHISVPVPNTPRRSWAQMLATRIMTSQTATGALIVG